MDLMKKNFTLAILNPLVWKCDMSDLEIVDTYENMNRWLTVNVDTDKYGWWTPPYTKGATKMEHNGVLFDSCLAFELEDDYNAFRQRFGVVK